MKKDDPARNRPADKGERNDPSLRDNFDLPPGTSTKSSSDTDDENERVTRTAADNFRTQDDKDPTADPAFDEVDND